MNRRVPATVLLLEGRDESRAAYREALRLAGLRVTQAQDSQRALDAVATINPKVIVASFDSQTRDDRLALCRAMRADPRTKQIPIVLIRASAAESGAEVATDAAPSNLRRPRADQSQRESRGEVAQQV